MELEEAKMKFIQSWGVLGSSWGIPKSMAQIHALLLSHKEGLSTEEMMEKIMLSRGNVNTNVRELVNWKLVSKQSRLGERKEYFVAEHDIWKVAQKIVAERKKREIQPVFDLLKDLKAVDLEGKAEDVEHFKEMIRALDDFVSQMNQLADLLMKINDNVIFKKLIKTMGAFKKNGKAAQE